MSWKNQNNEKIEQQGGMFQEKNETNQNESKNVEETTQETTQESTRGATAVVASAPNLPAAYSVDALFPIEDNLEAISSPIKLPALKILKDSQMFSNSITDETSKAVYAVIIAITPPNAMWIKEGHPLKNPAVIGTNRPDCSSPNGINADCTLYSESGLCKGCKFNEFKTSGLIDESKKDGSGKACKNMERLALFVLGTTGDVDFNKFPEMIDDIPLLLTLPPTSKPPLENYLRDLSFKKTGSYKAVATKITLEKVTTPYVYSKAKFEYVGSLVPILNKNPEIIKKYADKSKEVEKLLLGADVSHDEYYDESIDATVTIPGDAF